MIRWSRYVACSSSSHFEAWLRFCGLNWFHSPNIGVGSIRVSPKMQDQCHAPKSRPAKSRIGLEKHLRT